MKNTLPRLRAELGLSQAALAVELQVSRQTVVSLEKGRYDPSLPLAFRVARVFNCAIEDIFIPDDAPARPRDVSHPDIPAHNP
ncbi:helix-turn-helix transcriptional regulator [Spelaeicoccus albus]|uniref:Putative transcriptional regulator n=1 Tax=Spelaeicoccus albus TaxID=1280376 RepID=A0A7Z0A8I1_9MICO|nr:helix-turn-helix transcriptional regulator [Spelaeicoccus albus]NYI66367.1 putative transcriptional regulator [Spelaeicoccus albus]